MVNEKWKLSPGGGVEGGYYPRETSYLHNDDMRIALTPCNHGEKHYFSVVPIPLPLGSTKGNTNTEGFVLLVGVFSYKTRNTIKLNEISLTKQSGEIVRSVGYQEIGYYTECKEMTANADQRNIWGEISNSSIKMNKFRNSETYFYGVALLFDTNNISVEENFTIEFGGFLNNSEVYKIPPVTFSKGSALGGW